MRNKKLFAQLPEKLKAKLTLEKLQHRFDNLSDLDKRTKRGQKLINEINERTSSTMAKPQKSDEKPVSEI